jgi:hypothetical protein
VLNGYTALDVKTGDVSTSPVVFDALTPIVVATS